MSKMFSKMTSLFVLAGCWALCVSTLSLRTRRFVRLDLDDKTFEDGVIFEGRAASVVKCASLCKWANSCVVFTFHRTTCRGHATLATSSAVSMPGARSFAREWLYAPCTSTAECGVTNADCFLGQCLCTPGYFYSVGTHTCVGNCTELQPTYSVYPKSGIQGNNKKSYPNTTPEQCTAYCTADPECLNFEFRTDNRCNTNSVSPLTHPNKFNFINVMWKNFYQRDCA